jgi:hypothetical protein
MMFKIFDRAWIWWAAIGLFALFAVAGISDCLAHSACETSGRVETYDCHSEYNSLGRSVDTTCKWRCNPSPIPQ